MPRRKRLKSVANGVLSSFVSRNNDLLGYWALGKLYAAALSHSTDTVEFDLLSAQLTPNDAQFVRMIDTYLALFDKLLGKENLPRSRVREANIRVRFNAPVQPGYYPPQAVAKPFEATLDVTDHDGTSWSVSKLGWCFPHNPLMETKSSRIPR